jgi:hypothetical protein
MNQVRRAGTEVQQNLRGNELCGISQQMKAIMVNIASQLQKYMVKTTYEETSSDGLGRK